MSNNVYFYPSKFSFHEKLIHHYSIKSILLGSCAPSNEQSTTYVQDHYTKTEVDIPMRDGIKLHTTIHAPKNTDQLYPILMQRTPYSSRPYGKGAMKTQIGPNKHLMKEGYIFVYQDVRGRWMSEGVYDNMRAYIPHKKRRTKQTNLQTPTTLLNG